MADSSSQHNTGKETAPWWKMRASKFDRPTWAEHCAPDHSYESVMEIGAALEEEYPYFKAILTPNRTFLHFIIAELVTNVAIKDQADLEKKVNRIYDENIDNFSKTMGESPLIAIDQLDYMKKLANSFYDHKKTNKHFDVPKDEDLEKLVMHDDIVKYERDPDKLEKRDWIDDDEIETTHAARMRIKNNLHKVYDQISINMNKKFYIPGQIDEEHLNNFRDLFVAAAVSNWEQKEYERPIKAYVERIIKKEIAKEKLTVLPTHHKKDRKNIVITGNIAAGKTTMLHRLKRRGEVDRTQSAMIDMDEWRDIERVVKKEDDQGHPNDSWTFRSHEECHQIRRKIMDILDEKTAANKVPNVVVMTAMASQRIRKWLTEGNPETKVYVMYNEPNAALKNAYERKKLGVRSAETARVLNSNLYTAGTLHYLFCVETDQENRISLELIDTTNATFTKGRNGLVMKGEKLVAKANPKDQVEIYDMSRFKRIYEGRYVKTNAKSSDEKRLYNLPDEEDENRALRLLLRPHHITFFGKGKETATKQKGEDEITGDHVRSVMASSAALRDIYGAGRARGSEAGRG